MNFGIITKEIQTENSRITKNDKKYIKAAEKILKQI